MLLLVSGCNGAFGIFSGGGGNGGDGNTNPPPDIGLALFVDDFDSPVGIESPGDGTGRLFVVEQRGLIRIIEDGEQQGTFLDLTLVVSQAGSETGLLGLAFHPDYAENGRFFVHYTEDVDGGLQTVIAEYTVSEGNLNIADATERRRLLVIAQPNSNHNGGQLAFGPGDGHLYIALGDGGGGFQAHAQNTGNLLGKILRIDVDTEPEPGEEYVIPPDNPFAVEGGAPEIWAFGFRNPWRFSFDRETGELFAGDVGQNEIEEVDLVIEGENYGWAIMEGSQCFNPPDGCDMEGLTLPIAEYERDPAGGAIIGGFVYRGSAFPDLVGTYVFADLFDGRVFGIRRDEDGNWQQRVIHQEELVISAFGQDEDGELYVADYGGNRILIVTP